MPLSQSVERELIHTRDISCAGYLRSDGLWDIEGTLYDTKTYFLKHSIRNPVAAGDAVHDMKARITIGSDRVIRAVEVAMDAYAFSVCPDAVPNYQKLVGLDIGPGFTKQIHELVGHIHGCTHITWLFQCLVRVALQTLTKSIAPGNGADLDSVFGKSGETSRPAMINSCRAYATDSEVVQSLFPEHYRSSAGDGRFR